MFEETPRRRKILLLCPDLQFMSWHTEKIHANGIKKKQLLRHLVGQLWPPTQTYGGDQIAALVSLGPFLSLAKLVILPPCVGHGQSLALAISYHEIRGAE